MTRKLLSLVLALCLLFSLVPAFAQEATHTAVTNIRLKLRRNPSKDSSSFGSLPAGETVSITEYGDVWCSIDVDGRTAYVMTKYLDAVTPTQTAAPEEETEEEAEIEPTPTPTPTKKPAAKPAATAEKTDAFAKPDNLFEFTEDQLRGTAYVDEFTMTAENFEPRFKATTITQCNAFAQPDESSESVCRFAIYKEMDIGEVCGEWCYMRFNDVCGYILVDNLFKWDRYDPYAGDIPNLDLYSNLIWVNTYVPIREVGTDRMLGAINEDNKDTIMPGSAVAATEKDEQGRYIVPFERTYGYINEEDVAFVMPKKDWRTAQSGDLISVMTTFFSVGIHTMEYRGRNWNIRLATCMANNTVLQPGQHYDQNSTIGPYTAPTGYLKAPTTLGSGYGGGTCQVNSTFYITTVSVPLLVYQRQVHQNVGMHYCKIGLDSSVSQSDSNTLKMMNSLPYAVRYQFFVFDGVLTCAIFRD